MRQTQFASCPQVRNPPKHEELATSPEEAAEISSVVEKTDSKVMVGQGYRFMDSATILRQALQSGKIGELRAIRILFRQYVPDLLEPDHPLHPVIFVERPGGQSGDRNMTWG